MTFSIKLRDPGQLFNMDLGAVFIYRWNGSTWGVVGEIKVIR